MEYGEITTKLIKNNVNCIVCLQPFSTQSIDKWGYDFCTNNHNAGIHYDCLDQSIEQKHHNCLVCRSKNELLNCHKQNSLSHTCKKYAHTFLKNKIYDNYFYLANSNNDILSSQYRLIQTITQLAQYGFVSQIKQSISNITEKYIASINTPKSCHLIDYFFPQRNDLIGREFATNLNQEIQDTISFKDIAKALSAALLSNKDSSSTNISPYRISLSKILAEALGYPSLQLSDMESQDKMTDLIDKRLHNIKVGYVPINYEKKQVEYLQYYLGSDSKIALNITRTGFSISAHGTTIYFNEARLYEYNHNYDLIMPMSIVRSNYRDSIFKCIADELTKLNAPVLPVLVPTRESKQTYYKTWWKCIISKDDLLYKI
ncbi:hypothetical protein [Cysteiniphilum sp. QT6929]|uniref:hypothetical protein n=1 Tax=Cysteiniphilum sp. QT6929 TaxID=2975055 RepID=UPI0024B37E3E|nr:hypothetical protein [Cysteiniphilum sp. QT6929]WHN66620.1 hypothetical protein NYP54_05185 [Cysteiniphilum sp. QT6929]